MDRRVLVLIATAACSGESPQAASALSVDAGLAKPRSRSSDAAPEEEAAAPVPPAAVLQGAAAEQAIAQSVRDAGPASTRASTEDTGIRPSGVGRLDLNLTRAEVVKVIAGRGILRRLPAAPGAPSQEVAVLIGAAGVPELRLRVHAGRLVRIDVLSRSARLVTDEDVGVGSTFADAIRAHGDPRRIEDERTRRPLGWTLSDLPGVLLVPANPASLIQSEPPPFGRIGRLVILGPESLASGD